MKKIHIISFDIPIPTNYGGVVDVMQHLRMFKQLGIEVILHCFTSDRVAPNELMNWCSELHVYPRKTGILKQLSFIPYIVNTRKSGLLLQNILKDNLPIFFEGIHTCSILNHPKLSQRIKIVRTHNIEAEYYQSLAETATTLKEKIYFRCEASKLKIFEKSLKHASAILTVTENDNTFFKTILKNTRILQNTVEVDDFKSERDQNKTEIVFHGNLSVFENEIAAKWLAEFVAPNLSKKLIITGKSPNMALIRFLENHNCNVISSPSHEELSTILASAKVHVLPTFQTTGAKNKNLRALCAGGFCVVNQAMMAGTNLHEFVVFAETPEEFILQIEKCLSQEINHNYIEHLKKKLDTQTGTEILGKICIEFGFYDKLTTN